MYVHSYILSTYIIVLARVYNAYYDMHIMKFYTHYEFLILVIEEN